MWSRTTLWSARCNLELACEQDDGLRHRVLLRRRELRGAFAASAKDGTIKWLQDCHGDTYAAARDRRASSTAWACALLRNIGGFHDPTPALSSAGAAIKRGPGTVAKNGQLSSGDRYTNFAGQPAPSMVTGSPGSRRQLHRDGPGCVERRRQRHYLVPRGEFRGQRDAQQGLARMAIPAVAPRRKGPVLTGGRDRPDPWRAAPRLGAGDWPGNWDRDDLDPALRAAT